MARACHVAAARWLVAVGACLASALAESSTAAAQQGPAAPKSEIVRVPVITMRQMREIRTLRLGIDTIALHRGDTLDLNTVAIFGLDVTGDTLGIITLYDYTAHPDTLRLIANRRIVGVRAGVAGITIAVSEVFWRRRDVARPSVRQVVVVTDPPLQERIP